MEIKQHPWISSHWLERIFSSFFDFEFTSQMEVLVPLKPQLKKRCSVELDRNHRDFNLTMSSKYQVCYEIISNQNRIRETLAFLKNK